MPMYNTYSFTKSDYAAMLQHIVDLLPEWMFLYDPIEDLVVYHNQKKGMLFEEHAPELPPAPVSLRRLLEDSVLPEDWELLEQNTSRLLNLREKEIHEVRFRVFARDRAPGYKWCAFRQKVFWQDESTGLKLILCLATEVKSEYVFFEPVGIHYS